MIVKDSVAVCHYAREQTNAGTSDLNVNYACKVLPTHHLMGFLVSLSLLSAKYGLRVVGVPYKFTVLSFPYIRNGIAGVFFLTIRPITWRLYEQWTTDGALHIIRAPVGCILVRYQQNNSYFHRWPKILLHYCLDGSQRLDCVFNGKKLKLVIIYNRQIEAD